jgi:hypothetical protein
MKRSATLPSRRHLGPLASNIRALVFDNRRRIRRPKPEEEWGRGDKSPPGMILNSALSVVLSLGDQALRPMKLLPLVGQSIGLDVEVTDREISTAL